MPQHQITLRTPKGRLILIPPNAADDELNAALRAHPGTRKYLPYFPEQFSTDEARALRERGAASGNIIFHVHIFDDESRTTSFVGVCGFHNVAEEHASANVGILVSPDYHRGGIATEALYTLLKFGFEERKYHRLVFETGADNVMMKGWLEKVAGAEQEYKKRECWKASDRFLDVVGYSLLAWEWSGGMKARLVSKLQIEEKHANKA